VREGLTTTAAAERRRLAAVWTAGFLVRLALMPATFHTDLYQIYSRASDAVIRGDWLSWSGQVVIQQMHNVWFLAMMPVLPESSGLWSIHAGTPGIGAQPEEVARFLSYAYLGRALVLMKLPYVIADLATGWLLTRLVEPRWRTWALTLWWLNPVVVYTSAVFGRHDAVSVLAMVAAVMLGLHGHRLLGLLLLGLGGLARFFPLFSLPFYVVAFRRSWRQALVLTGVMGSLWLGLDLAMVSLTGESPTLALLTRYPHVRYLLSLDVPVGEGPLPLLPLAYTLLLLWWLWCPNRGTDAFLAGAAATMLLVTALMPFHPQYVLWAVPLLVPWMASDKRLLLAHGAQIALYLVWLSRWGSSVTWQLFQPLGPGIVDQLPDPQLVAAALVPAEVWQPVVRALFAAVSLWLAWRVLLAWRSGVTVTGDAGGEAQVLPGETREQGC
jgi:hypothetical protein